MSTASKEDFASAAMVRVLHAGMRSLGLDAPALPLTGARESVPDELRDIVLAIVRDRPLDPVAHIATTRRVRMLYGADGAALAEFCDDEVTAGAFPDGGPETPVGSWREWELELAEGCGDRALLDRLGQRLHDAGATPAGHGSKLARVLDAAAAGTDPADTPGPPPADPIHRAVAQQVAELITWDRAVRADHKRRDIGAAFRTEQKVRAFVPEAIADEFLLAFEHELAVGVAG